MKWYLVVILSTEIGFGAGEPVYFKGPKPYDSLEECMQRGEKAAQWLHQDFVTVKWKCGNENKVGQEFGAEIKVPEGTHPEAPTEN